MDIIHIYRKEKGQTLVETAIILLLILSLLFGITEFGRAWFYSNALTNAVRNGARYASIHAKPDNSNDFTADVQRFTIFQILSTESVPVGDPPPSASVSATASDGTTNITDFTTLVAGDSVQVTATYSMNILTGSIIPYFSGTKTMTKQATMRYEGN